MKNNWDFNLHFWTWYSPLGYLCTWYDCWIKQFNLGFFCVSWRSCKGKEAGSLTKRR